MVATLMAAPMVPIKFEWTPTLAAYFDIVFRFISQPNAPPRPPSTCDFSRVAMPIAPTPLPTPPGLVLEHVAVGRGVQHYTCAKAATTPAAAGAAAKLFNVTCIAANYPNLLRLVPNFVLQYPLQLSDLPLSAHHYFSNDAAAIFAFDAATSPQLGTVFAAKGNSSRAPADAMARVNGTGSGAVPWLYLTSRQSTAGDIKAVYRLNTAGGQPPQTCANMPAAFSVDYAALYWFWK